jgi:hypothetical protein
LLVSIAILALPMALYGTELQGYPARRPTIGLLLGSLAAHCVEVEAFFWMILVPGVGRLLARWRSAQSVPGTEDRVQSEALLSRVVLWFGPCYAVFVPVAGWAIGYRTIFAPIFELAFLLSVLVSLALIPVGVIVMIGQLIRRPRSFVRSMMQVCLLLLAIPCWLSFQTALNVGWSQLESEIGLSRLGRECTSLCETPSGEDGRSVSAGSLQTAAMRRIHPAHVSVTPGRNLEIELHGGMDHYGYYFAQDDSNR